MRDRNPKFLPDNKGFWIGLIFFAVIHGLPESESLPVPARRMLATAVLMVIWWMTETLPLGITALLPLVLYPISGIMSTSRVAPSYMDHLVFLFLCGFIIATALQEWHLHRKFALYTIAVLGTNYRKVVFSFMLATALLSMWISNTATALMMLPIAIALIKQISGDKDPEEVGENRFAVVILLGIAYASSMGGVATLIGTPPNIIFMGIFHKFFPQLPEISFLRWMMMLFPLSCMLFLMIWIYLVFGVLRKKDLPKLEDRAYFKAKYQELGPLTTPQKWVLGIFVMTAVLWIFRSDLHLGQIIIPGWPSWLGLKDRIQDSTIAMGMAILLFLIQVKTPSGHRPLLKTQSISLIPWDILLLFGGGFALAEGIQSTGLAEILGKNLEFLGHLPLFLMLLILTLCTVFITEFTSNTAVATAILPITAALAIRLQLNPLLLMLPVTIASSCAFMLPVATPPNAIVFGSRYISIKRMIRIGINLNFLATGLITFYFYLLFKVFLIE